MEYATKTAGAANGSGSKGESITIAFMANGDTEAKLSNGKVIPKFKDGWKANDEAKAKAKTFWDTLKAEEKKEITEHFAPTIGEFLEKKKAFKDFTASAGSLGRRLHR